MASSWIPQATCTRRVRVVSGFCPPDGTHLGTIQPDEVPANVAWGDDGSSLYMTARTGLYRIKLLAEGPLPADM